MYSIYYIFTIFNMPEAKRQNSNSGIGVEHESQTQQTLQVSSWWQLPTGTISSICHQLSSSRCSSGMVGLALPRLANTELRDLVGGLVSSTLGDVGAWTSEVQGVLDLLKMGFVMLRLFLPYLGENVANTILKTYVEYSWHAPNSCIESGCDDWGQHF